MTDILNYFYLRSNQNTDFPTYFLHIFQCDYAALQMHLFGTMCPPAFAIGWLPVNTIRVDLLSLTPAFRNMLNYPILSPDSKPSTLSDFAQMFREKSFFFL